MNQLTNEPIYRSVNAEQAESIIKENEGNNDFVILDVRTTREVSQGHIPDAININYYEKNFPSLINKLDSDKKYLVYCHTGVRSLKTVLMMKNKQFLEAYNLLGGIDAWAQAGLPIVKPAAEIDSKK